MIVGLLCRHLKIYKGINFIPLSTNFDMPFSVLVGNNAVGKSSVLEGLDAFFNRNSKWNRTKNTKRDEAFIAPVFLINKKEAKTFFPTKVIKNMEILSGVFWKVTEDENPNLNSEAFNNFFEFREKLKDLYSSEDFFFFILGTEFEKKEDFFSTFQNIVKNSILEVSDWNDICMVEEIKKYYSYIYIPIESEVSNIIQIENEKMQSLMSSDILSEIDEILKKKEPHSNDNSSRKSIIEMLNNNLDNYMDEVNKVIEKIDKTYTYNVEINNKKNLTPADVRGRILEAYFSIRTLKKEKKEVHELSSGEQRIALIDIATAFLTNQKEEKRKVILAIDEPESSLHNSKLYGQFDRLQKLSEKHQIILTTHWYGILPLLNNGDVQYLSYSSKDQKSTCLSFEANKFFEKKRSFPDDINLKSYFDLSTVIISSLRLGTSWIVCEGTTDKKYIEYYLGEQGNIKVLVLGGCGSVVKLFNYLYLPISEKERSEFKGKIICITDTDPNVLKTMQSSDQTKEKELSIFRISENEKLDNLVKFSNPDRKNTEIEDVLEPKKLFDSLVEALRYDHFPNYEKLTFNSERTANHSRIKSEFESIISKEDVDQNVIKEVYEKIDKGDFKNKVADLYVCQDLNFNETPIFFNRLKKELGIQNLQDDSEVLNILQNEENSHRSLIDSKPLENLELESINTLINLGKDALAATYVRPKRDFTKLYFDRMEAWPKKIDRNGVGTLNNFVSKSKSRSFEKLDEYIELMIATLNGHKSQFFI